MAQAVVHAISKYVHQEGSHVYILHIGISPRLVAAQVNLGCL